jgi:DNA-binding transcriptional regulator YiaG
MHKFVSTQDMAKIGTVFRTSITAERCDHCAEEIGSFDGLSRTYLVTGLKLAELGRISAFGFRNIRKGLELDGVELAQLFGVTPETISHWENERTPIPRLAWATMSALASEALQNRTDTFDRLKACIEPRPMPALIEIDATAETPMALPGANT